MVDQPNIPSALEGLRQSPMMVSSTDAYGDLDLSTTMPPAPGQVANLEPQRYYNTTLGGIGTPHPLSPAADATNSYYPRHYLSCQPYVQSYERNAAVPLYHSSYQSIDPEYPESTSSHSLTRLGRVPLNQFGNFTALETAGQQYPTNRGIDDEEVFENSVYPQGFNQSLNSYSIGAYQNQQPIGYFNHSGAHDNSDHPAMFQHQYGTHHPQQSSSHSGQFHDGSSQYNHLQTQAVDQTFRRVSDQDGTVFPQQSLDNMGFDTQRGFNQPFSLDDNFSQPQTYLSRNDRMIDELSPSGLEIRGKTPCLGQRGKGLSLPESSPIPDFSQRKNIQEQSLAVKYHPENNQRSWYRVANTITGRKRIASVSVSSPNIVIKKEPDSRVLKNALTTNQPLLDGSASTYQTYQMQFSSLGEAHEQILEPRWKPTTPDNTIPRTNADTKALVKKVFDGLVNTTNVRDHGSTAYHHWVENLYPARDIELVAWSIVDTILKLHLNGSTLWVYKFKKAPLKEVLKGNQAAAEALRGVWADQHLNFQERFEAVVNIFTYWKSTCDYAMTREKIDWIVNAPLKYSSRLASNQRGNYARGMRNRRNRPQAQAEEAKHRRENRTEDPNPIEGVPERPHRSKKHAPNFTYADSTHHSDAQNPISMPTVHQLRENKPRSAKQKAKTYMNSIEYEFSKEEENTADECSKRKKQRKS
ncbi:hypothetical protein AOQ84DRAFT_367878 [Glonium stellatum]|uniref:Uncharacterized protein n=1 Tax=Glonium stellatum TaxID=574774 RepID=A0A8E2JNQ9_9PEZI|nr:hypothetical protein AOQ84DRAFT_367878 [Glonium stellatum]